MAVAKYGEYTESLIGECALRRAFCWDGERRGKCSVSWQRKRPCAG